MGTQSAQGRGESRIVRPILASRDCPESRARLISLRLHSKQYQIWNRSGGLKFLLAAQLCATRVGLSATAVTVSEKRYEKAVKSGDVHEPFSNAELVRIVGHPSVLICRWNIGTASEKVPETSGKRTQSKIVRVM